MKLTGGAGRPLLTGFPFINPIIYCRIMAILDNKDRPVNNTVTPENPDNNKNVSEVETLNTSFSKPPKGKMNIVFFLMCLVVTIACVTYFVL